MFFILGYFLLLYPTDDPKNQNVKKMKKRLEITSFYTCVPKIMMKWCTFLKYGATDRRTDGRMDGRKKSRIEVGAPPKNAVRYV